MHNGHLNVLKFIDQTQDVDELIIGLGSVQYSRFNKSFEAPLILNPFTLEERKAYIEATLDTHLQKPYKISPILDQHDHNRWAAHTLSVVPEVKYIYYNGRKVMDAFSKLGYECRNFPTELQINSTLLRQHIANEGDWEQYVPQETSTIMKEMGLDKVIMDLYKQNPDEIKLIHENQIRRGIMTYDDFLKAEEENKMYQEG